MGRIVSRARARVNPSLYFLSFFYFLTLLVKKGKKVKAS